MIKQLEMIIEELEKETIELNGKNKEEIKEFAEGIRQNKNKLVDILLYIAIEYNI